MRATLAYSTSIVSESRSEAPANRPYCGKFVAMCNHVSATNSDSTESEISIEILLVQPTSAHFYANQLSYIRLSYS